MYSNPIRVSRRQPARARRHRSLPSLALLTAVAAAGLAAFAPTVEAAITRRNWDSGDKDDSNNTLQVNWSTGTLAGNLLVATVAVRGGSNTTITPPSGKGWTLATRSDNGTQIGVAIYYIKNAPAQTGSSIWTVSGNAKASISIIEYDGVDPTNPLDLTATSTGTGTTASTGSGVPVSEASELAVGIVGVMTTPNFSNLTNGFTRVDAQASQGNPDSSRSRHEAYQKLFTGAGDVTASIDLQYSVDWAGAIATFRATALHWIGSTPGTFSDNTRWSLTAGGPNNTTAPATDDTVRFDSGGSGACTMNANTTVDSIDLDSTFTGTVTLGSGRTLTLAHDLTVAGGTFNGGGGSIETNGSGNYRGNLNVSGGTLNGNGSAVTVQHLTVSAGTYNTGTGTATIRRLVTVSGGTLSLGGSLTQTNNSYTYTQSGGTFNTNAFTVSLAGDATFSGGTFNANTGSVSFSGDATVSGGTFNASSGTVTFSRGATITSGSLNTNTSAVTFSQAVVVNGGTLNAGSAGSTAQVKFNAALTIGSGGTLQFPSSGGWVSMAANQVLTVNGTIRAASTVGATQPKIDCITNLSEYTFTIGATAVIDLDGLEIYDVLATGVTVANGATFTELNRVKFMTNAGGAGSKHLAITANTLALSTTGCYFDTTAAANVQLIGNGDASGRTVAGFEFLSTAINGSGAGEALDIDDDNSPVDGVGDNASNGAVVLWLTPPTISDTAGTIEGAPTAAFDWNTFAWYGVYVAYRDSSGTTDRIYVRTMDGAARYSYDIPTTYGDIVGTPKWDSLNETTLLRDVNGDGDMADASVHVVYIATSGGDIFKLIDNGSSLALPASGAWSTPFSSASVATITSPLASDLTNLYFGGTNGSAAATIFAVQIAGGTGDKTLVRTVAAASTVRTTPAWRVYNGTTYLFLGSALVGASAHMYRVEMVPGGLVNADCTEALADVNGSIRILGYGGPADRAFAVDSNGRLHGLDMSNFTSGAFKNVTGFPYRDTTNHTAAQLSANANAIASAPFLDSYSSRMFFGDNDGHLYAISTTGALYAGFPIRLTTSGQLNSSPFYSGGIIVIGSSDGMLYFVDQHNASNVPQVVHQMFLGATNVSSVGYNSNRAKYMVATGDGQLYFIDLRTDPTPTFN